MTRVVKRVMTMVNLKARVGIRAMLLVNTGMQVMIHFSARLQVRYFEVRYCIGSSRGPNHLDDVCVVAVAPVILPPTVVVPHKKTILRSTP